MAKSKADKPIHFVPDGKNFGSLDKMKFTFKVTEIHDEKELIKYLEKGNHVYCYLNTDTEIVNDEEVVFTKVYWNKDRETAIDNYYRNAEEI